MQFIRTSNKSKELHPIEIIYNYKKVSKNYSIYNVKDT